MNNLPNIPPKLYTLSAIAVGYLLIDDASTANEQNAIGNWLMLVAQVISTNAYFKQAQNPQNNQSNIEGNNEDTITMMQKMINALNKEVENLKKNL